MSGFGGISRYWFPGELEFDGWDNTTEDDYIAPQQQCHGESNKFTQEVNPVQNVSYSQPALSGDFDQFPTLFGYGVFRNYRGSNGEAAASDIPIRVWNNASAQAFRMDIGDCIEGNYLYSYLFNESGAWLLNLRSKEVLNESLKTAGYSSSYDSLSQSLWSSMVGMSWVQTNDLCSSHCHSQTQCAVCRRSRRCQRSIPAPTAAA